MTTTRNNGGIVSASPREQPSSGKLAIVCLVLWVFLGPVLGILYENYINGQEWSELATMPAPQQDTIRAEYFSDAILNVFGGAIVWIAGMIVFAIPVFRARA